MGIFSKIFGGGVSTASKEGQRAAQQENIRRQGFIERITGRGGRQATRLFNQSRRPQRQGFQGALDVIGAGVPEQLGLFQSGNVAAQGALSQGLPQFLAAILGQDIDFGAFQPQRLEADTSFLQDLNVPRFRKPPEELEEPRTGALDLLAGLPVQSEGGRPLRSPRPVGIGQPAPTSPDLFRILSQFGAGLPERRF